MTVRLRRMRWWDVEAVLPLERALFPDPWTAEQFWSELAGVPRTRWYAVAEDAGVLAGYAGLMVVGATADVQTLAVALDRQRAGFGRLLLDAVTQEAAHRGAAEILLEVRAGNAAALALYDRAGFQHLARRRGYYGPGADALVLRRRLTPGERIAP